MQTNPLLDELNGLSPGAKAALASAHGQATSQAASAPKLLTDPSAQQLPPAIGPGPAMAKLSGAPPLPPATPANIAAPPASSAGPDLPMMSGAAAPVQAPKGTSVGDQQERSRLLNTGSGIGQIKNPFLRSLAEVGNTVGHFAAPGIMTAIPGTAEHHQSLLNQNAGLIAQDQKIQGGDIANREKAAQAANTEAMPELNQAKLDLKTEHENNTQQHQTDTLDATLREHGYKHDETGKVVPLEYGEMSPQQQAVTDLKGSQDELASATADLKRAQKDGIPAQVQMAQQRIRTAQANAQTAMGRLGLQRDEYKANFLGTDAEDNPLAGGQTDEATGKPVGVRVANAGNPSADRLKRSDLANNVLENTQEIRQLITANPNLFGKMAGHATTAKQMIGSDDPAIARLGLAIHNAALASNGAHGLRSQEAIAETEGMLLNHFRNSPQATIAALDEMDRSVKTFVDAANRGKKAQTPEQAATASQGQNGSGKFISMKEARGLDAFKGKNDDDIKKAAKQYGYTVKD